MLETLSERQAGASFGVAQSYVAGAKALRRDAAPEVVGAGAKAGGR